MKKSVPKKSKRIKQDVAPAAAVSISDEISVSREEELKKTIAKLQDQVAEQHTKIRKLEEIQLSKDQELEQLRRSECEKIDELSRIRLELKLTCTQFTEKSEKLKALETQLAHKTEELGTIIRNSKSKDHTIQAKIEQQQTELQTLSEEIKLIKTQREVLENEKNDLKQRHDNLASQLNIVISSREKAFQSPLLLPDEIKQFLELDRRGKILIPRHYICRVTGEIMFEPIILPCGSSISLEGYNHLMSCKDWLDVPLTSPRTGESLRTPFQIGDPRELLNVDLQTSIHFWAKEQLIMVASDTYFSFPLLLSSMLSTRQEIRSRFKEKEDHIKSIQQLCHSIFQLAGQNQLELDDKTQIYSDRVRLIYAIFESNLNILKDFLKKSFLSLGFSLSTYDIFLYSTPDGGKLICHSNGEYKYSNPSSSGYLVSNQIITCFQRLFSEGEYNLLSGLTANCKIFMNCRQPNYVIKINQEAWKQVYNKIFSNLELKPLFQAPMQGKDEKQIYGEIDQFLKSAECQASRRSSLFISSPPHFDWAFQFRRSMVHVQPPISLDAGIPSGIPSGSSSSLPLTPQTPSASSYSRPTIFSTPHSAHSAHFSPSASSSSFSSSSSAPSSSAGAILPGASGFALQGASHGIAQAAPFPPAKSN